MGAIFIYGKLHRKRYPTNSMLLPYGPFVQVNDMDVLHHIKP